LSSLQLIACLALGLSAAPAHTAPASGAIVRSTPGELEEARHAARERLVVRLTDLADWCTKKKLYASRVGVYDSLLHFDPDHTEARRGLGYKRGRDGEWLPPKKAKSPRDWDKSAAREFPERRTALVVEYREEMLQLLERFAENLTEAERDAIFADILFADPDDPRVRELRGEVKVGDAWVLVQTSRAATRRAQLKERVVQAFSSAPKPQRTEPNERELALGIEWTAVFATPEVRSLGTGEESEIERMVTAMHATRSYFNGAFGCEASYPDPLTVFTLPRASDKLAFLMGHPSIEPEYRKFLMDLDGSGIQGSGDLAHWAPDERRRMDGMVRQAIGWLLAGEYGIGTQQGWIFEGFGLYMTRELVGTRLTWFVRESKYLTPEEDQALKARLMDSKANWMNEAYKLFTAEKPTKLQFMLGKTVNQLTTEDMLYAYVLAAFLLEAESEKLPGLIRKIGAGSTSQEAFQLVFGLDVRQLDERVKRWLSERR
jgi:hypothetical protein